MEVAEPQAQQPPTLPMDLLLEIIARCDDVMIVVRCAVACKPLRRAMLAPGFLDLLRRRAEANGGFDPSLLMAVSYRLPRASSTGTDSSVVVQPPGRIRFDTELLRLGLSSPAYSRDGLLVVHRHGILLVCNTITGHVTSLPRRTSPPSEMFQPNLLPVDGPPSVMFQPALLSVAGAGRSFELFVMYEHHVLGAASRLGAQIFSSQEDEWGAVRMIHTPKGVLRLTEASFSAPAVVGRSVHWLCYIRYMQPDSNELIILALHAESAHASVIKLPQELVTRMGPSPSLITRYAEKRILATTATVEGEKRLSLVVAETLVISTWTLVRDAEEGSSISWSRQVVIRRREIDRPLTSALDAYQPILLRVFGERSGTVLFWMEHVGLVQLNLGTKKALVLWRGYDPILYRDTSRAFLHEINLISVLECMKSF